jgi:L-threonylcarbamoyladenylate synthase
MFRVEDGIAALQAGELVVYPTETFYAIGADAFSSTALERLFLLKGREPGRPVGLIAADTAMAFSVARDISADARRLAKAFWPGPLTIVLPARDEIARELTATSANLSGAAPASALDQARNQLGRKVRVYLEGGKLTASAPSTVVAVNASGWKMVRAGAISESQIAAAIAGDA